MEPVERYYKEEGLKILFQEINNNLKRYDFIIIDKFNDVDFMKIRKKIIFFIIIYNDGVIVSN